MKNIFNKTKIKDNYFDMSFNTSDLLFYLYDNLEDENFILSSNLQLALKNNLNEKYI
jgi:c-di-AMP phosphodiesterase-like protein